MAVIGSLIVDLVANTGQLNANLAKADKNVATMGARMNKSLARVDKSMKSVGRAARGMGAAMSALAVAGVGAFVKRTLDSADALAKQADRIGISTDQLQRWRHAAELSGVGAGKLDSALKTFGKRFGEFQAGTGALNTFLNKMDPAFAKMVAGAQSSDEALRMIFDRMAQMENASDRAALSAAAFSKSIGVDMVSLAQNGSAALDGMLAEAQTVDEGLLRSAEAANDAMTRLGNSLSVIGATIALSVAPALADFADMLAEHLPPAIELVKQGFAQVMEFISPLITWLEELGVPVEKAGTIFAAVFGAGGIAVVAIGLFSAALAPLIAAAGPLALLAAAVTAVVLAVQHWDEIVAYAQRLYEGIKLWLQDKLDAVWEGMKRSVELAIMPWKALYDAVVGNSWVPDMIDRIGEEFARLDTVMVEPTIRATNEVEGHFSGVANSIDGVFRQGLDRAGQMINKFVETGKLEFQDFTNFVIDVFANLANQVLTGGQGMGSLGGGLGGLFSNIIGGIFAPGGSIALPGFGGGMIPTSFASMPLAGGFARGGRVRPGAAHLVGEKRPELFVPDTAGTIMPEVGGGAVTYAPIINVTVEGGDDDEATGKAIAKAIDDGLRQKMADFVQREMRPGGQLKQAQTI